LNPEAVAEVGASRMLLPENRRKKVVSVRDVEEVVAKIARVPPKSVSRDDKKSLMNLERDLRTMVFGQDAAITALSSDQVQSLKTDTLAALSLSLLAFFT
jgi:ATP-dependent Clp protease ATP-binding subunit ClpA